MIDKIKSTATNILAVRKDLSDPKNPIIANVVMGPIDKMTSFGPIPINTNKLAKFLLNDVGALRNKYKVDLEVICDPVILSVLFGLQELQWFSRKDLVAYLEQNINDALRDSE